MQGTGLWHASSDSKPMFCFSPTCTSASHRMFVPSQAPQHHSVFCTKWFVDPATAIRLTNPHKVEVSSQRQDGLFFSFPIQAMIKFFQRKQSLKTKISSMYEDMKQAVLECIDSCKAGKLQELDYLDGQMENFRRLVLEGVSLAEPKKVKYPQEQRRNISIALNSLITSHKFSFTAFKNTELFNISSFAQNTAILKQKIQKMGENILKQIDIEGGYQRLQYEDMINVEVMLLKHRKPFGETDFEKEKNLGPDTLTELVNWQQSDYFSERSTRISDVKCPLCKFQFESSWVYSVGKPKSAYYDVLVKHLLEQHLLFLALCYSHRISRTAVIEMPVSELIYLMTKSNYDQLDIYDGPNTKYVRYEPNPRCLSVIFVAENSRIEEIQYCYCIAKSPEEAAYIIVLLMEEVCVKMDKLIRLFNFKRNYYHLFSTIVQKYNMKCLIEEKYPPSLKTLKSEKK